MKQRGNHLSENVRILRTLWSTENANYSGHYSAITQAQINPKPTQASTIPIWFGGHSEPSLRRMVELADGWIGSASGMNSTEFCSGVDKINQYAIEVGRDPSSIDFAKLIQVSIDGNKQNALRLAYSHWKSYYGPNYNVERTLIYGNPNEVYIGLSNYLKADVPEVTLILEPSNLELDQLHLVREVAEKLVNN
ncbi:LLM class flavin-dependent oxidoreductase [SAR202 cluster bacterium AD-802-E10_MRT_200m]|nr:LLM class flavin-dependent oxidoreductase [SAR202 cluster bacterium AD-802-E10_MRT_200m]